MHINSYPSTWAIIKNDAQAVLTKKDTNGYSNNLSQELRELMSIYTKPLSIVVPALNEADNLTPLVTRIATPLIEEGIEYEILVIDDHSTDNTASVARKLAKSYNVRLVSKVGKRGKAYSLLQGFDEVQYPLICMIDADLQYPPEAIMPMYRKLVAHDADIVVTNRVDHKSSPLRQLSTKVSHFLLARVLFGIDYDTQSGLKLFKKSVLDSMDLHPSAWSFDLEFLIRSLENHATILSHTIPFGERYSGETKVKLFSGAVTVINSSLKLRMNSSSRKVRRGYQASLELSKRPAGMAMLLVAGAVVGSLALSVSSSSQASALSFRDIRNAFSSDSKDSKKQSATPAPAAQAAPAQPAPPPAATAPASASGTGTPAPAATTSPAPAAATQPATNKAAATSGDSSSNTSDGKKTNYYPEYALSSNKTSALTRVAATLGLAGAGAVVIGGLTWGGRALYLRHLRKTSRNLYQV